jgi:nucleotide-binding universal stress UspA family protein
MMHILVATGGSAHSDTAVRQGAFLASKTESILTLLTVIRHDEDRSQAEAIITKAAALAALYQVTPQKQIRVGQPAVEIVQAASQGKFDLIVVGERPVHRLVKRLIGPTAERVIAHMPCPVWIARQEIKGFNRMLLCEGGREPSLLVRLLKRLAPLLKITEEVTILHVMSQIAAAPNVAGWELQANAEELMARHAREGKLLAYNTAALQELAVHLQAKVRHGLVVDEVLAEARDGSYDIVVIGAHQGSGWERYLLDDLAHQIITKSDSSVLVI